MIGVDVISINQLPKFFSNLEQRFFHDNYSNRELYFISKTKNKQYYLALIFSLKESIIKCDNSYIDIPFNKINIISKDSAPYHEKFSFSFSGIKTDIVVTCAMLKNS